MKIGKRILSLILMLALMLTCLPVMAFAASSGTCGDNVKWTLSSDGTLTISGTGAMADYDKADAPWYSEKGAIKRAVIQSGVTTVGDAAFYGCRALERVTIPAGITKIGDDAFHNCEALSGITIPEGVTTLGNHCFENCETLTGITIPDTVTTIGEYAFQWCSGLTNVVIPDSVTSLGAAAFSDCYGLTNVTISNAVTEIGSWTFYNCSLTGVTIPKGVTAIGDYAFSGCSLSKVTIPNKVTSIGEGAFENNEGLTEVTLPAAVATIGGNAFDMCSSLTGLTIKNPACEICDEINTCGDPAKTVIYGAADSTAQTYAKKHGYRFNAIAGLSNPFTDVKETDWFFNPVMWAIENGITTGTSGTTFSPKKECTRAQVVTFLWNAAGKPEPKSTTNPFSDAKSTDYFYKAVLWAVESGVTSGVGDGKFGARDVCTRGQVVAFMWNAAGKPEPKTTTNSFSDVKTTDYYYKAVLWAVENGVTSGTGNGQFSPKAQCTRAAVVTFLYSYYG